VDVHDDVGMTTTTYTEAETRLINLARNPEARAVNVALVNFNRADKAFKADRTAANEWRLVVADNALKAARDAAARAGINCR
jgi:hypothetical protein